MGAGEAVYSYLCRWWNSEANFPGSVVFFDLGAKSLSLFLPRDGYSRLAGLWTPASALRLTIESLGSQLCTTTPDFCPRV